MATTFSSEGKTREKNSFWSSGHTPTLIASLLYFDLAFMVWVMLGPLAPDIARTLDLTPAERGLMVAVPTLAGAVLRVVNGLLVDRIGPKRSGGSARSSLLRADVSLSARREQLRRDVGAWLDPRFAGASFAIALPLASRWYPPEHQGKAMGIAGMGNSGTVLASLFAPALAQAFGWNAVLGLACIPLTLVFFAYMLMAKDAPYAPQARSFAQYLAPLGNADAWWLMGFYAVTFGGFVGLAASLPIYFTDQFGLTTIQAGYGTAACVFAGSLVRPLGGALADAIGGVKVLARVLFVAALGLAGVTVADTLSSALFFFVVPCWRSVSVTARSSNSCRPRFASEIGVVPGLVGMAGGIGGFLLAARSALPAWPAALPPGSSFSLRCLAALAALPRSGQWRRKWASPRACESEDHANPPFDVAPESNRHLRSTFQTHH